MTKENISTVNAENIPMQENWVDTPTSGDLFAWINNAIINMEADGGIIDCTRYTGVIDVATPLMITRPCVIRFGAVQIRFDNSAGQNMFNILSDSVMIEGIGRAAKKNLISPATTVFEMLNPDSTLDGYHVKGRGCNSLALKNCNLKGVRTDRCRQYGNPDYPINGVGGIYLEKGNPGTVSESNTLSQITIENVLIAGTKSHGIYMDTPIVSRLINVRISDAGGHGIFINNGTSTMLETVYVASANYAGFLTYGLSYASFMNCVAENAAIGFWIRSCTCVNMFSPACEELYTIGANPWRVSQPVTGKYGMNLSTTTDEGVELPISDVGTDNYGHFLGIPFLITGGRNINLFSPYAIRISKTDGIRYESYPNGVSQSNKTRFIKLAGNVRRLKVENPQFTKGEVELINRFDIEIPEEAVDCEFIWNPDETTLNAGEYTDLITSNPSRKAPVFNAAQSTLIRSGASVFTPFPL